MALPAQAKLNEAQRIMILIHSKLYEESQLNYKHMQMSNSIIQMGLDLKQIHKFRKLQRQAD